MAHQSLGNVFINVPPCVRFGRLVYDPSVHHCMLGFDPAALLPICRNSDEVLLRACCVPYENIADKPFIHGDLQICMPKDKRVKIGYVWTAGDQDKPVYQVVLDRELILKKWSVVWIHVHTGEDAAAE